ncbi:hypothetical protein M514_19632 [Trichuris suis]|uniref:Uncharacterized protein n=1 Tax=Trichuris suis TaxID=68888 RepID=A0A085NFA4_9BILA|nr:hypothetical protein M514_19632 [Trichuris suis]
MDAFEEILGNAVPQNIICVKPDPFYFLYEAARRKFHRPSDLNRPLRFYRPLGSSNRPLGGGRYRPACTNRLYEDIPDRKRAIPRRKEIVDEDYLTSGQKALCLAIVPHVLSPVTAKILEIEFLKGQLSEYGEIISKLQS